MLKKKKNKSKIKMNKINLFFVGHLTKNKNMKK